VTIWKRYFAIVLAAIPAALLADMLISRGLSERAAMMIGVPFALALAFLLWRVVIQRQSLPRKDHKRVIVKLPQSSQ
jgi:hypothetical protein